MVSVGLGDGVTLDLSNGKLTLNKGATFETPLSVIDASWLVSNIGTGAGQLQFTYTYQVQNDEQDTGWETKLATAGLTKWKTENGSSYYWVTNRKISADALDPDTDTEAYLLVVTDNAVKAYIIGG